MQVVDCLFCKLVAGEIPSDKVFEDEEFIGFRDIRPQAPTHVLVIPKQHIDSAQHITLDEAPLIGRLHAAVAVVADTLGLAKDGYRVVTNVGRHGQQTVPHLHYHILGGKQLGWPPG